MSSNTENGHFLTFFQKMLLETPYQNDGEGGKSYTFFVVSQFFHFSTLFQ